MGSEVLLAGVSCYTADYDNFLPSTGIFMAAIELNTDNFQETIENNDIVLIDFWASWCGPCQSFGPVFEAAADKNPEMAFAKVNTEDQTELAANFQVRSIPMLAVFKEQVMVYSQAGALPASSLDQLIEQVKGLDMDKVRADIAEQKKQS
ncbi:Thioredoxin [hydrothermal vent metagenome]|uniref:Thioredoxin n=1 Tax=hydrothermal vent metagenome TaxID=652676 RepID=A0A3B0YM51_9ZZZZ